MLDAKPVPYALSWVNIESVLELLARGSEFVTNVLLKPDTPSLPSCVQNTPTRANAKTMSHGERVCEREREREKREGGAVAVQRHTASR